MGNSPPVFIIVMLMVCCLVVGFLVNSIMVPPPANVLICPKANVSVECPQPDIHLECPAFPEIPQCPDMECGECQYVTNEYGSHFQKIITSVFVERGYEYDHMNWNCDEMSDELKDRLRNADYDCKTKVGWYNNGTSKTKHQWVECDNLIVEATNGQIVHIDEYWRYDY